MEFLIRGTEYSSTELNAIKRLYLARRSAQMFYKLTVEGQTLINVLPTISQEDFEYLVEHILPTIYRKDDTVWAKIYNVDSKSFMYSDITGGDILEMIINVLPSMLNEFFNAIGNIE